MAHSDSLPDFPASSLPSSACRSSYFQRRRPPWWMLALPPGAWLLIALLIIFAPLAILTGESLLLPLADEIRVITQGTEPSLPASYFAKVALYGLLSWMALIQVIYRLEVLYVSKWSQTLDRPHPLHVDYQAEQRDSMIRLLGWTVYRTGRLVLPTLGLALFTVLLAWGEFTLFNTVLASPAFTLPLPFIIGMFLLLLVVLFTGVSALQSVWNALQTVYGSCVAITEPELPYTLAFSRSMRLSWVTRRLWLLLLGYGVGWLGFAAYVSVLMVEYDIDALIHFQANWPGILGAGLLLVIWTIALTGYKFFAYHRALRAYYVGLPAAVQAQFRPPPETKAHPVEPPENFPMAQGA